MPYLIILVLGVIQGACEFLPISSSGHLVVFFNFFSIYDNTIMLSIILHFATLLSLAVVYYKELWLLIKNPLCKTNKLLLAGTIPTIIIVLLFHTLIEQSFSGNFVIICFLFTAALLVVAERYYKYKYNNSQKQYGLNNDNSGFLSKTSVYKLNINYAQAIIIGLSQGVATLPGISRSGATIATGLIVGVHKNEVANFSFLLSIPAIIGSLIYELFKLRNSSIVLDFNFLQLLTGFIVAFIVGVFCLKLMINFVRKQKLYIFSIYLILLCLFLVLNKYIFLWF